MPHIGGVRRHGNRLPAWKFVVSGTQGGASGQSLGENPARPDVRGLSKRLIGMVFVGLNHFRPRGTG
jgi:hypothetical protein